MMIPCTAREVAAAVGGKLLQGGGDITRVSTDSRDILPGDLFVPLVGERFDGHAYIDMALQKGASGCLCAQIPEKMQSDKFYIAVDDTEKALGSLAGWYRGKFDIPVVQVTGSAGKTTTKEMLAAVLSQHFHTLKTLANFNNFVGTPQTLLRLERGHQAAVIETGMDHFGEIRRMGAMVRPTIAVITNVGDAHIGNLDGTRQGVLRAKSEIFENLQPGGLAVLNGDDPLLNTLNLPFRTPGGSHLHRDHGKGRLFAGYSLSRAVHDLFCRHGRGHRRVPGPFQGGNYPGRGGLHLHRLPDAPDSPARRPSHH